MPPTPPTSSDRTRLRRARFWIGTFIAGLFLSGVTAFPLESELALVVRLCHAHPGLPSSLVHWLQTVHAALVDENSRYPFLAYGTDWLAFAHIAFAVLFIGPWIDPSRNRWVLAFGLIACAGILPLALIAGPVRGIPFYWRLIDCSFGVFGALVLWPAWRISASLTPHPSASSL